MRKEMQGSELLAMMKEKGYEWAVIVAEIEGKPCACLAFNTGQFVYMEQHMLEAALPMLQSALEDLKAGRVPKNDRGLN